MAHKKAKKKTPKKKSFDKVRNELVKALDRAKEKFGTDAVTSKKIGFSENYVSNLRYDINNNGATYEKVTSVKKKVLDVMKPKETIDLSKVAKKTKKVKKPAKKKSKKTAEMIAEAALGEGPFFTPIKIELKEEMVVRVGGMTFATEVVVGESVDVVITRGKTKILARI